jgi:hypothetical protein
MNTRFLLVCLVPLIAACASEREQEERFVEKELAKLQDAMAARSVTKVTTGCVMVTTSVDHVPKLADEIKRLCYVEAPRLYLETSIADTIKGNTEHPGMSDINCMQLFVEDAFTTLAAHPTTDAGLKKLVEEYTRLCPGQVAKFRAK